MNSQDITTLLVSLLENGTIGSGLGTVIAFIIVLWMIKNLLVPLKAKFDKLAKSERLEKVHSQAKLNNEEIVKLNSFGGTQFSNIIAQLKSVEEKLSDLSSQNRNIDDNVKNIQQEIQIVKNNIDNDRIRFLQDRLNMMNKN